MTSRQWTYSQAGLGLCEDTRTSCGGAGTDPSHVRYRRNPASDTYSPSSPLLKSLDGTERRMMLSRQVISVPTLAHMAARFGRSPALDL